MINIHTFHGVWWELLGGEVVYEGSTSAKEQLLGAVYEGEYFAVV